MYGHIATACPWPPETIKPTDPAPSDAPYILDNYLSLVDLKEHQEKAPQETVETPKTPPTPGISSPPQLYQQD